MSELTKKIIVLSCGLVVFLYFLITKVFTKKTNREKFIESAKLKGNVVKGNLISNKLRFGNDEFGNSDFKNDKMKCIYEYTINGISYKKTINFYSNGLVAVKYPYEITVYYDEKNPKRIATNYDNDSRGKGCLVSIVLSLLTMAIMLEILHTKLF